jgi:16S rRNA (guanine527-N7)-methyltransferase
MAWDHLVPILVEARGRGFLGPGPVEPHLAHAAGFAESLAVGTPSGWEPAAAADLGSGAGLPGLPLALHFPSSRWILIDSSVRRAAFLREAVTALGVGDRVQVLEERAEVAGRRSGLRGALDVVVARSFGPPAVTAECAAPLLREGGRAVVSEPPGRERPDGQRLGGQRPGGQLAGGQRPRWPEEGLALLGLVPGPVVHARGATFQVLVQDRACGDRFPRRTGMPGKRPLF